VTVTQWNYQCLLSVVECCGDMLQWQASLAVNELQQFVRAASSSSSSSSSPGSSSSSISSHQSDCAVIICGDFNSPPHTLPYQLLLRARIDDVMLDKLRRTCQFHDQVSKSMSFNGLVLCLVLRRRLLLLTVRQHFMLVQRIKCIVILIRPSSYIWYITERIQQSNGRVSSHQNCLSLSVT